MNCIPVYNPNFLFIAELLVSRTPFNSHILKFYPIVLFSSIKVYEFSQNIRII